MKSYRQIGEMEPAAQFLSARGFLMSNSILMGGKGGGPGNLAPSAPAGLAQEVIYSQVSAFLVVHSAHSRRLTCVNISGYLVSWVIENDCSARRTSQRFQGGCLPGAD